MIPPRATLLTLDAQLAAIAGQVQQVRAQIAVWLDLPDNPIAAAPAVASGADHPGSPSRRASASDAPKDRAGASTNSPAAPADELPPSDTPAEGDRATDRGSSLNSPSPSKGTHGGEGLSRMAEKQRRLYEFLVAAAEAGEPAPSLADMAARIETQRVNATNTLRRLGELGHIKIERNAAGERSILITATGARTAWHSHRPKRAVAAAPAEGTKRDQLRALWEQGLGGREIGDRLGWTQMTVYSEAKRLGLPRRRHVVFSGQRAERPRPTAAEVAAEAAAIEAFIAANGVTRCPPAVATKMTQPIDVSAADRAAHERIAAEREERRLAAQKGRAA